MKSGYLEINGNYVSSLLLIAYTCQLFFSKMREIFRLHRIWISEDFPTASEDCQRFRKTSEDRQRLPMTSEDFLTTSDDNRRCRKIFDNFKTGPVTTSKGFQTISSIIEEFWRCSDDFSNVKKQLHSLLSVRCEKLVWMCEITILDLQEWDSRIIHESWQV